METVGGTYYFHGSGVAVNWRHPHILLTSVLTGCRYCNPTARNVAGDAEDCSSMKLLLDHQAFCRSEFLLPSLESKATDRRTLSALLECCLPH